MMLTDDVDNVNLEPFEEGMGARLGIPAVRGMEHEGGLNFVGHGGWLN